MSIPGPLVCTHDIHTTIKKRGGDGVLLK
uniref:Uncharacterized protein n=1 Tax=Anguilla anguilla TaxID=7936 RepID=A0A0E9QJ05_ANGAN